MRFVAFVALTENGPVAVEASHTVEGLRQMAIKAREAGTVKIDGKDVPIVGGCVFASDSLLQGPTLEFRCLTPKQREAKAKRKSEEAKAKDKGKK